MARSSFDFDGGLAYALSSVKQKGISLIAEQTQALKLLSEGIDKQANPMLLSLPGRSSLRAVVYSFFVVWLQC